MVYTLKSILTTRRIFVSILQEKLQQLGTRAAEIFEIKSHIQSRQTEQAQVEKAIADLLKNIENEFQGSTEDLKRLLNEFQDKVEERQDKLTHGHKENIRKRDTKIVEVADNYSFEGYNLGNISDEKYKHFFEEMKNSLETKKAESKSLKAQYEEEEEKLQKKLDNLKESKTKLESSERLKTEMMTKNIGEIRQINQKLSNMEVSAGRLDHITTDLKRAEQDLTSLESNLNLEDVKREIAELDKTRKELTMKISDLNTELNKLTLESNVQAEVNMYNKDKVSKEDNIRRLKSKHEDTINYLLGDGASTQNLRGKLEDFIYEQGDSVKRCSEELQNAQRSLSSKEAQQKMLQQQLRQKEDELRKLDDKILTVCGSQNYDDEYQNVQQKLTQTQESRGSLLGAEHFFKQYVTDLEKTDPCCPLCHRGFETEEDVRQLILELQDKLRRVPSRLNKAEKDLEEYQTKYDNMTQLKPLRENKTDELQAKENDEGMAKSMQPDVLMIDRYQGELRELERKIATKSAMLSGGVARRTIEVVVEEKGDKEHTLDNLNKTLDHKRQKMSDHTEKLQRLKTKVHDLKSEKLQITSELQQRTKLEESKISLISDNKQLEDDIKDAREEIKPLETQITRTKAQKDDVVKEKEEKIESANQEV
ncbi:DNA repair protein RAD50 [Patella vulgata]|uniref:DNA repair protein RAD50 n=1 Tax=Patella vulgata TaxID=6465 RepID=UPI0024A96E52|nr:DNA repair protein RAD50 [Patella vulgata]